MKTLHSFASFFAICFIMCGAAGAEDVRHGCKEDVKKFCSDVTPGEGRIMDCLKAHGDKISPQCKETMHEKMEKMHEKAKEAHAACKEDIQKNCADVKPGEGRIMHCLKEHEEALSAQCKDELHKMHKK